jgi:hypothetical protein
MESAYPVLIITTFIVLLNYIRVLKNRTKQLQNKLVLADRYIASQTFHIIVLEGTIERMVQTEKETNHESNS